MFPVYNSTVPHSSHNHSHTHATHPDTHTLAATHQPSDQTTSSSQPTAATASALSTATAATSLPIYSSYQLQQKAGYLQKEGDVWRTWKRRYFVLSSQLLSYYSDRDATTPKGHIQLQGAEVRVSQRSDRSGWLFEVYRDEAETQHRVYYLQADSEVERDEWIAAIKNNILYELNRTRALVDEVDGYKQRIAQLNDQLERHKAQQILADLNRPHTTQPQPQPQPPTAATQPPAATASDRRTVRTPSSVELYDKVGYLEAENTRLLAENQSLKRSTLAMQGKGDEIRHTAETRTDEATAQQSVALPAAAAVQQATVAGEGSEVDRLTKELARVRMERSILKREVLRLMKVNDELTHSKPAATAVLQPSQPAQTLQV